MPSVRGPLSETSSRLCDRAGSSGTKSCRAPSWADFRPESALDRLPLNQARAGQRRCGRPTYLAPDSQRWRPERSICRSGESMRGRAGWRPDHVIAGPRADSRVPEGGPAELRRRRGLAAPGRVDRYTEDPRPACRRSFGSGEATSSSESASTSVVVRGVPRDLGGNTAGGVVRQASDDDRDGGNVFGRLATHGQHGVVLAAPGR
jgi:hypothetical protein